MTKNAKISCKFMYPHYIDSEQFVVSRWKRLRFHPLSPLKHRQIKSCVMFRVRGWTVNFTCISNESQKQIAFHPHLLQKVPKSYISKPPWILILLNDDVDWCRSSIMHLVSRIAYRLLKGAWNWQRGDFRNGCSGTYTPLH